MWCQRWNPSLKRTRILLCGIITLINRSRNGAIWVPLERQGLLAWTRATMKTYKRLITTSRSNLMEARYSKLTIPFFKRQQDRQSQRILWQRVLRIPRRRWQSSPSKLCKIMRKTRTLHYRQVYAVLQIWLKPLSKKWTWRRSLEVFKVFKILKKTCFGAFWSTCKEARPSRLNKNYLTLSPSRKKLLKNKFQSNLLSMIISRGSFR